MDSLLISLASEVPKICADANHEEARGGSPVIETIDRILETHLEQTISTLIASDVLSKDVTLVKVSLTYSVRDSQLRNAYQLGPSSSLSSFLGAVKKERFSPFEEDGQ
ncbi:hypothetical protein QAD02_003228 [Eretmocerus hayati]|uniref:Uncharacterized protein n=1 Tax=Eretmocerus hayati TaxID=131215 RepID=A0ACC2NLL4_9HYME|nr:hypothetical protein QAD02_003228 [Eretmocerus hayati]